MFNIAEYQQSWMINESIVFTPKNNTLTKSNNPNICVTLQTPASLCLLRLMIHRGKVISQKELMLAGWGDRANATSPNTFYQTILTLRKAMASLGMDKEIVKTIYRRGLVFSERITVRAMDASEYVISPLNNLSSSETETLKSRDVIPFMETTEPALSRSQTQHRFSLLFIAFFLVFIVGLSSLTQAMNRPDTPFQDWLPIDISNQSLPCKLYRSPQQTDNSLYQHIISQYPDICLPTTSLYMTSNPDADRVVIFICYASPAREEAQRCDSYYFPRMASI